MCKHSLTQGQSWDWSGASEIVLKGSYKIVHPNKTRQSAKFVTHIHLYKHTSISDIRWPGHLIINYGDFRIHFSIILNSSLTKNSPTLIWIGLLCLPFNCVLGNNAVNSTKYIYFMGATLRFKPNILKVVECSAISWYIGTNYLSKFGTNVSK